MTDYRETDDSIQTVNESYTVIDDDGNEKTIESKDTNNWSAYDPCPHCGGEEIRQLEVGESTAFMIGGELMDFGHSEHLKVLEMSCESCGKTLWRHMAVQLIFDELDDQPF
jgi:predicted RNA-binding Zn-ribbon protein involved in translation (DUF1610 family)